MNQEHGKAQDASGAQPLKGGSIAEAGKAHGVYTATLVGPREDRRAWYSGTYDALVRTLPSPMQIAVADALRRGTDCALLDQGAWQVIAMALSPGEASLLGMLAAEQFEEKWSDCYPNVITTVGANQMLDTYFAGSGYTAATNMFLKGTGSAVIGDTMASHGAWSEVGGTNAPVYTGNRPNPAWSSASAKSKAITSAQNFAFTSGGTVAGSCFVQGGSSTKDNTTGTLVSAGDFTGGSKTVSSSDQLNVSWSISV